MNTTIYKYTIYKSNDGSSYLFPISYSNQRVLLYA